MNEKEEQNIYEVSFEEKVDNVYIVADNKQEAVQIIGQRYDSDRFNLDWRDFEIVNQIQRSPKSAVEHGRDPYQAFWLTEDGEVHGIEQRTNSAGKSSLYYLSHKGN